MLFALYVIWFGGCWSPYIAVAYIPTTTFPRLIVVYCDCPITTHGLLCPLLSICEFHFATFVLARFTRFQVGDPWVWHSFSVFWCRAQVESVLHCSVQCSTLVFPTVLPIPQCSVTTLLMTLHYSRLFAFLVLRPYRPCLHSLVPRTCHSRIWWATHPIADWRWWRDPIAIIYLLPSWRTIFFPF